MGSGSHNQHTALNNLSGRTLSGGSYGTGTWWFGYSNTGGVPNASCGYCHPSSTATHQDGTRNLYFAPTDTNANIAGTLKARNAITSNFTQTTNTYVTCSSTYCHSNGYSPSGNGLANRDYTYRTSPDWFNGTLPATSVRIATATRPRAPRPMTSTTWRLTTPRSSPDPLAP